MSPPMRHGNIVISKARNITTNMYSKNPLFNLKKKELGIDFFYKYFLYLFADCFPQNGSAM